MFTYRVYYEDTDAGGLVYHANYLKFAERARTDWLRNLGIDQSKLLIEKGLSFVVYHMDIHFVAPAKLDDLLEVHTKLIEQKKVTMKMEQTITCQGKTLTTLLVSLACVDRDKKPTHLPTHFSERA